MAGIFLGGVIALVSVIAVFLVFVIADGFARTNPIYYDPDRNT